MRKRVKDLGSFSATVGVHEEDGAKKYPSGVGIADVAHWQHNGTATIPPTRFLDVTFQDKAQEIRAMKKRVALAVINKQMTVEQGLKLLAVTLAGMVKKRIVAGIGEPPKHRPEGKRLIDTSQLIGAIKGRVSKGAP